MNRLKAGDKVIYVGTVRQYQGERGIVEKVGKGNSFIKVRFDDHSALIIKEDEFVLAKESLRGTSREERYLDDLM